MTDERLRDLQRQIAKIQGTMAALTGENPTPLLKDFALPYLSAKLANPTLRAATKRSFEASVLLHLIPAFGLLPLDKINNTIWLQWVVDKRREATEQVPGARPLTRFFNVRKALLELLNAAKESGELDKVPRLDNPDEARNVGRVLEDSEVLALLWRARKPFRFIFYSFWKMGCRPREILKWEWEMIRFSEPGRSWIDIPARISKCDRARSIAINPEVSALLAIRRRVGNGSEFVFPSRNPKTPQLSYHAAFKGACRRANVKNAVVYDFRRTFITRCAIEGKPLIYVAKALDTSTKIIESTYAKAAAEVMEGIVK